MESTKHSAAFRTLKEDNDDDKSREKTIREETVSRRRHSGVLRALNSTEFSANAGDGCII